MNEQMSALTAKLRESLQEEMRLPPEALRLF
ncbi:hypothetical protein MAA8898_00659 [Maliponia aquimaris]|uniref:Uncharacterized protein n=1 Tax=Maliponia aquimaris TaxID=1673631 RepID=A0A238JYT9_9RHOB|nr:hypothetical protein MAA8898_00659 [Maliponia aquimaris]